MYGKLTAELLENVRGQAQPLRLIEKLSTDDARIWLKLEWTDPAGTDPLRSIKRKPAALLFADTIEKHYAGPGRILISATSGNFGIEVGLLALERGHTFFAVVPGVIPEYNLEVLRELGIHLIRTEEQETCPREFTVFYVRGYSHEFHHRLVNIEQYYSWLNPLAHTMTTAREIFDSPGAATNITHLVAAVGSCGTICGIRQYLEATGRRVELVGVQPALHHGVPGTHIIKGDCRWSPENYSPTVLPEDSIHTADTVDAYAYATKLWQLGIPAGPSTGMALAEAMRLVEAGARGDVVVLSPDSNFKYGDLLVRSLRSLRKEMLERYPNLISAGAIDDYIAHLETERGLEWMLERVRHCYRAPHRGQLFEARHIEDIVAGHVEVAGLQQATG